MPMHEPAVPDGALNGRRRVLVALDLHDSASQVLSAAADLAENLDLELLVVHVVHDSIESPGRYTATGPGLLAMPMDDVARERLSALVDGHARIHPEQRAPRRARLIVVDGLPAGRILEVIERERPEHVVLGSSGRGGLSRLLAGSVSEAVTRQSDVPVTIVKTGEDA